MKIPSMIVRPSLIVRISLCLVVWGMTPGGVMAQVGSIGNCPATPEITRVAVTFVLSPQSGLTGQQADALLQGIVQQATRSAPYLAAQIVTASVRAVSTAAIAEAKAGQGVPNSTAADQTKSLPAALRVTAVQGYALSIEAITLGAVQGSSDNLDIAMFKKVCSAIAVQLILDAGNQAAMTAELKQAGKLNESTEPPMDSAETGALVAKTFVAAAEAAGTRLGFSAQEVARAINTAGADALAAADKMKTAADQQKTAAAPKPDVSGQVASQVASQVAAQQSQSGTQNAQNSAAPGQSTTITGNSTGNNSPAFANPPPAPTPTPSPKPPIPPPAPASSGGFQ